LVARLNHASLLRGPGGQAVLNTAEVPVGHDEANAAAVANGTARSGPGAGLISVPHVAAPTVPDLPQIPASLAPLPGEAHARALYGGPGSSSLYEFAGQWSRHGDQLRDLADILGDTAEAINEHWDHGAQQAGADTGRHGSWAAQMSQQAHGLAASARTVAQGYDRAKAETPSPAEFDHTRTRLQAAVQRYAATRGAYAAEVQQWIQTYASQQADATQAVTGYHGQITAASFSIGPGPKDAPPITGNGGPAPLDARPWKPGDKRH
jgi:hypothetical protein